MRGATGTHPEYQHLLVVTKKAGGWFAAAVRAVPTLPQTGDPVRQVGEFLSTELVTWVDVLAFPLS